MNAIETVAFWGASAVLVAQTYPWWRACWDKIRRGEWTR